MPVFASVHTVGNRLPSTAGPGWIARLAAPMLAVAIVAGLACGCSAAPNAEPARPAATSPRASSSSPGPYPRPSPVNVYAHIAAGMMNPKWARDPYRIYVPNSLSDTVSEINPDTFKIIRTFAVGGR